MIYELVECEACGRKFTIDEDTDNQRCLNCGSYIPQDGEPVAIDGDGDGAVSVTIRVE